MNTPSQVEGLQGALRARSKARADEVLAQAKRESDRVITDARARLDVREAIETRTAEALAERTYRQLVQSSEIAMREDLDRARWVHVQAVMDALKDRLALLVDNEAVYLPLLESLLAKAADAIESDALVAQLGARDFARWSGRWEDVAKKVVPGKHLALSPETLTTMGGVLVRSADNRIRVNNTFEGRIERFELDLERTISECLFVSAVPSGPSLRG